MTGVLVHRVEAEGGSWCPVWEMTRCLLKMYCISDGVSRQRW